MTEPVGCDEVGDEYAVDFVSVLLVFHWVAYFTGPEGPLGVLVGAVEPGVDGHFADFVGGADAD